MPRIFESTHTEEFYDSPNALITVTISGLTLEEYIRVRDVYNKEFHDDFWKHDKESKELDISS
jgi:hypothetical protein